MSSGVMHQPFAIISQHGPENSMDTTSSTSIDLSLLAKPWYMPFTVGALFVKFLYIYSV